MCRWLFDVVMLRHVLAQIKQDNLIRHFTKPTLLTEVSQCALYIECLQYVLIWLKDKTILLRQYLVISTTKDPE